jgi:alpha-tubulin suppressor-like RCC1 family protein
MDAGIALGIGSTTLLRSRSLYLWYTSHSPFTKHLDPAPPSGRVFCFGYGNWGCLGHGDTDNQKLPREIDALRSADVACVSVGLQHALALTYAGDLYSWGNHGLGLGHGKASGRRRTAVVACGPKLRPKRVEALQGVRVRCIAAAKTSSCAVTKEGHVYTWGDGPLGHVDCEDEVLPRRVEMLYENGVVAVGVVTGSQHTLVADADGAVWGFGALNAIGAWNEPTVKAMRETEDEDLDVDYEFVAHYPPCMPEGDCFRFMFPHGVSSVCKPVRVTVNAAEDFKVLRR